MLVLAIDTSSSDVVAALHDDDGVVAAVAEAGAQAHGELLAPAIDAILRSAGRSPSDLTNVVVGVGPGPFTGLRVGLVTALVMADALGIPVHGVCSLDVVAAGAGASGVVGDDFVVATDARRKEVYLARYVDGRRLADPLVTKAIELPPDVRALPAVGVGAGLYAQAFSDVRSTNGLDPAAFASVAADLVRGTSEYASLVPVPLYLRRPDAVENAARKRVTQP